MSGLSARCACVPRRSLLHAQRLPAAIQRHRFHYHRSKDLDRRHRENNHSGRSQCELDRRKITEGEGGLPVSPKYNTDTKRNKCLTIASSGGIGFPALIIFLVSVSGTRDHVHAHLSRFNHSKLQNLPAMSTTRAN